ncbi:protocatechuate 3,4-dioxygenase subunit alpha [Nitratireductor sp. ZSWI3]|uniref:protocatechuate 3,4-dioxygenase subunit alpha n=1 Tax=Nitratireductor sp. ZSWI3 TaxID=2966359 RepID=UPI00214FF834|nr:protocatechuate 3,4-dioxygenase subunit alpha [Nitratireductor sp. ZSWI3]MCR4269313.1 protocatechuate 3,4-dioxygenase subunit alpha [Nitratireductor sp. ZSWI3]
MAQQLGRLKESASQTAGPYVHIGLTPNFCDISGIYPEDLGQPLVNDKTKGERVAVVMRIFDGTGTPLKDVLVETWQADAEGLYNSPSETRGAADPNFQGWGRFPSNMETGEIRFETVKPGRVPFPDGRMMAPHISLWIVARGINLGLSTRMYFGDEAKANDADPVLTRLEHQNRIATLIAPRDGDTYTFDIHLQGDRETVFFDI